MEQSNEAVHETRWDRWMRSWQWGFKCPTAEPETERRSRVSWVIRTLTFSAMFAALFFTLPPPAVDYLIYWMCICLLQVVITAFMMYCLKDKWRQYPEIGVWQLLRPGFLWPFVIMWACLFTAWFGVIAVNHGFTHHLPEPEFWQWEMNPEHCPDFRIHIEPGYYGDQEAGHHYICPKGVAFCDKERAVTSGPEFEEFLFCYAKGQWVSPEEMSAQVAYENWVYEKGEKERQAEESREKWQERKERMMAWYEKRQAYVDVGGMSVVAGLLIFLLFRRALRKKFIAPLERKLAELDRTACNTASRLGDEAQRNRDGWNESHAAYLQLEGEMQKTARRIALAMTLLKVMPRRKGDEVIGEVRHMLEELLTFLVTDETTRKAMLHDAREEADNPERPRYKGRTPPHADDDAA